MPAGLTTSGSPPGIVASASTAAGSSAGTGRERAPARNWAQISAEPGAAQAGWVPDRSRAIVTAREAGLGRAD